MTSQDEKPRVSWQQGGPLEHSLAAANSAQPTALQGVMPGVSRQTSSPTSSRELMGALRASAGCPRCADQGQLWTVFALIRSGGHYNANRQRDIRGSQDQ